MESNMASASGTKPMERYILGLRQMAMPSSVTVPDEGGKKPLIMASRVVLPAPFGPKRPVTPGPIVMVTSLTATTLPNQRETPASSMVLIRPPPS